MGLQKSIEMHDSVSGSAHVKFCLSLHQQGRLCGVAACNFNTRYLFAVSVNDDWSDNFIVDDGFCKYGRITINVVNFPSSIYVSLHGGC